MMALPAHSASFDCAKAATKVEKLICADAGLSKLDEDLNAAYKTALQDKKQSDSIKQAQKQWVKERDGCVDVDCVKRAYDIRLSALLNAKQEAATLPAQAKAEAPIQPHVEEACLAPKIDWRNYEWILITGNGLPVCKEMLAYVKSRPEDISPPTCPEERLPSNGNWTRPESRILSEDEKQALLSDIPEQWRQKPVGVSYERQIKNSGLLRVIRGDITRDGIPESLLALGGYDNLQQACERSKRCVRPEEIFKKGIVLTSDFYHLLPMNDEGTLVNWSHRTMGLSPMLMRGELIYYKGLPYWMSAISWDQSLQDNFARKSVRADDPYSAIFSLSSISSYSATDSKNRSPNFKDVTAVSIDRDPASNRVCRFGYFHRDNLKQNPPNRKR
jgi:uncharacterized protein YecT (DUF1311 family)